MTTITATIAMAAGVETSLRIGLPLTSFFRPVRPSHQQSTLEIVVRLEGNDVTPIVPGIIEAIVREAVAVVVRERIVVVVALDARIERRASHVTELRMAVRKHEVHAVGMHPGCSQKDLLGGYYVIGEIAELSVDAAIAGGIPG